MCGTYACIGFSYRMGPCVCVRVLPLAKVAVADHNAVNIMYKC